MVLPIEGNVYVEAERMPRAVIKPEKRSGLLKLARVHFRRIGVILLNVIFGHIWVYALIGFMNKYIFNKPIKSIFMLYPANEKYTRAYVYAWYARSMKWKPRLVGVLKQNKKWGMIFGISATEEDYVNPENINNLKIVEMNLERIRKILGADQKTFAGILPGVLSSKGVIRNSPEREVTVKAVLQALARIRSDENLPQNTPVIILGGEGFIGSALRKAGNGNFHTFDLGLGKESHFFDFFEKLRGKPTILLNITKKGALSSYISYLWPEIIVVNEVYPEPSGKELSEIKALGSKCYHIIGVKGKAWPGFPRGYAGGIPCCASFWPENGEGYEVLVKKM